MRKSNNRGFGPKHVENREDGSGGVRRKNGERLSAVVDGARAKTHVGIGWDHARADHRWIGNCTQKDIQTGPCGVVQIELPVRKGF